MTWCWSVSYTHLDVYKRQEVRDGKDVYVVKGDVRLFTADDDVMLTNSGTTIGEHYTKLRISLDGLVLLPKKASTRPRRIDGNGAATAEAPSPDQTTALVEVSSLSLIHILSREMSQELGVPQRKSRVPAIVTFTEMQIVLDFVH